MPDAIWIDQPSELQSLAQELVAHERIGVDTEFLRERTFFPKLCLLQLSAGGRVWCVDALRLGRMEALWPVLGTDGRMKIIHAARQDLEALYLAGKCIVRRVFDTQIAAACIGLKPQIGYAELVKTLLAVDLVKGQTRTDWSRRPLTRAQLDYAADDVLYLEELAAQLAERLRALGREHWVREDCLALEERELYEPDPSRAWERLRGIGQLAPLQRSRAKTMAIWRERYARRRDLPRSWILPDAAIFSLANSQLSALRAPGGLEPLNQELAASLLEALEDSALAPPETEAAQESRPTPEQRSLMARLADIVDRRAADLQVSAEILAPRGELKALAMGSRSTPALEGWRREQVGTRLLDALA